MTEQPIRRCAVGSATDNQCPRPALVRVNSDEGDPPDMCLTHAVECEARGLFEDWLDELGELIEEIERRIPRLPEEEREG